jgi:hypothetical protein
MNFQRSKDTEFVTNILHYAIEDMTNGLGQEEINSTLTELTEYKLAYSPD